MHAKKDLEAQVERTFKIFFRQVVYMILKQYNKKFYCFVEILFCSFPETTYPSFFAHNKLGPKTIATLLGVILLISLFCASFAKNLIKYLQKRKEIIKQQELRAFLVESN